MKTLKLQIGKTYRSRSGKEVKIVRTNNSEFWPFVGDNDRRYAESGSCWYSKDLDDLIEEVTSEITRHTFIIPNGAKEVTVEQIGNRIVVEMVPEEIPEKEQIDKFLKAYADGVIWSREQLRWLIENYLKHREGEK